MAELGSGAGALFQTPGQLRRHPVYSASCPGLPRSRVNSLSSLSCLEVRRPFTRLLTSALGVEGKVPAVATEGLQDTQSWPRTSVCGFSVDSLDCSQPPTGRWVQVSTLGFESGLMF